MDNRQSATATHPAYAQLRAAAINQRRDLARALAIEADWRYHDGPEWTLRYQAAFGDPPGTSARESSVIAQRTQWQPLPAEACDQTRQVFRALLRVLHPEVMPRVGDGARTMLWLRTVQAYRTGDRRTLLATLREVRALRLSIGLPQPVLALRAEYHRLGAAREAADRRLAELSQQFPFCLRDKLDDADWLRRQRLALRQIRNMATAPVAGAEGRHKDDHKDPHKDNRKQVS